MRIREMWTGKLLPLFKKRSNNAPWKLWIAGGVYFLVFTFLIISGLFFTKVSIHVNEPSPQLIRAPWDKDIDNVEKWYKDREEAAKAVEPVYMVDPDVLFDLNQSLRQDFTALVQAAEADLDDQAKIDLLKKTEHFVSLPEMVLDTLVKTSEETLLSSQDKAQVILLENIQGKDTGAKTNEEIDSLKNQIKRDFDDSNLSDAMNTFLKAFVDQKITRPTLIVNQEETRKLENEAKEKVQLQVESYRKGQKIVGQGDIVDEKIFNVLLAFGIVDTRSPWRVAGGNAFLILLGMLTILGYVYRYKRDIINESWNKMVLLGLTMALVLFIGKGAIAVNISPQFNMLTGMLIPVAWATMSVAILVNVDIALVTAFILAMFVGLLVDPTFSGSGGFQAGLVALFGGIVGVHSVSHLSQRSDLARAGIYVSAINILTISGIALATEMSFLVWLVAIGLGVINGISSSVLTVGSLHWLESGFHITSGVRLLELSDPNRPLLKRLLMEAPGTYHHSILVGNLAEAAAEAVGADSTLVRVGSMYHDIGKLKRPYFFIENQFTQDNPHEKIAPTLSALIITSHVKDGVELAKEHKLPQPITDIVLQHHGSSIVSFFYHKATEENPDVPEEPFRYEAPNPRTKEAALVLLADSVEAAVRAMKQPNQGRIEGLVRKMINEKLNDGVLNQCDLTFQDLDRIANAFVTVLTGIFHSRIEYPELPSRLENSQEHIKLEDEPLQNDSKLKSSEED